MSNPNTGEVLTIIRPVKRGRPIFPRIPGMPSLQLHPAINLSGITLYHCARKFGTVYITSLESPDFSSLQKSSNWVNGTVTAWLSGTIQLKILYFAVNLLTSVEGYPKLAIVLLNPPGKLMLWRDTFLSMSSRILPGNILSPAPDGNALQFKMALDNVVG